MLPSLPPHTHHDLGYMSLLLIYVLSRPAVDCFVLITGFFLTKKNLPCELDLKKHRKVYIPLLWCIPLIAMYILIFHQERGLIKNVLATGWSFVKVLDLFGHLWYIVGYIWILLLAPFLNRITKGLSKMQYQYFIILISILLVGLSSINDFFGLRFVYGYTFNSFSEQDSYNIVLFIPLYFIGGYISKFDIHIRRPLMKFLLMGVLVTAFTFLYSYTGGIKTMGRTLMGMDAHYAFSFYEAFCKYNNIFILLMSYFLFMTFRQMDFKSKVINTVAKGSYTGNLVHMVVLSLIYFIICHIVEAEVEYPFYTVKTLPRYSHVIIGVVCATISLLIGMSIDKTIGFRQKKDN